MSRGHSVISPYLSNLSCAGYHAHFGRIGELAEPVLCVLGLQRVVQILELRPWSPDPREYESEFAMIHHGPAKRETDSGITEHDI